MSAEMMVPALAWAWRRLRIIPVCFDNRDAGALKTAIAHVAAGGVLGIFPEGAITRDGELQTFRPGMARILERSPVLVVPMGLSGLWGSVFSRCHRGLMRFVPKAIAPCIRLRVGAPVEPADADPAALRTITLELRGPVR
jgi:1-acyl-sn-glycerol-3-phosphate acyltransferase